MIVTTNRLYTEPVACNGLLIIGDPHVSSRRPGRRKDDNWPEPILKKLEACAKIAKERNLATVLTGDLFDEPVETDESLKTRLIRILRSFPIMAISNVGNHDILHAKLSDGDTLAMMATSDVLDVKALSGPVCEFQINGKRIGMGMTPYGQTIPDDVSEHFPKADGVIWFTHHDIAFEKSYPKAIPPFPIKGCKLVINGHMHETKPPVPQGGTLWTNPGNINRQSVDLIDHVPSAWVLGGDGRMDPIALPHKTDVFDLTGKLVDAIHEDQLERDSESAFINLLQAESTTEMAISADGSLMREEIEAEFKRSNTPEPLQAIIRGLLAEAVKRRNAA